MAKTKAPLIQPNQWNVVKGNDLVEMGYRKTSEGFLIASNLLYNVYPVPGKWQIELKQNQTDNGKKKTAGNKPRRAQKS